MLRLRSGFKVSLIVISILLLISCNDIPRDNVLDPKNPNSYRAMVISMEAFVNTDNDQMYNEYMLSALQTIIGRYPQKLVLMQYHRNTTHFSDSLAIPENEILYEQYLSKYDNLKGVPDVFINGSSDRIKGASSVSAAVERIDDAIQPYLIENAFFTIEPTVTVQNSTITLSAKIARLGAQSVSDIVVRAILAEQIDSEIHTKVVRSMESSTLIPRIGPGEQKEIKFSNIVINSTNQLYVIFTVLSNDDLNIHQSIEVSVH